ncbi:MAG: aromatic ring-hydroxylating dioxygenase subunit alpha [Proteobacteria bacterium]|nr:aromatic ring-hydroxylating dioxygenase subunit alpha [Pseudomonadota bacterium]
MEKMTTKVNEIRDALHKVTSLSFDEATVMPASYYTSDDFMRLESEFIFHRDWVCLGRVDELKNPGDFYTTELVGEQLLVTRGNDNVIRVLSNVCRHRGNTVAFGSGRKSRFSCRYHAWTYDLTGQLVGAPRMENVKAFDRSKVALPSFKTEVWEGFLFVNMSGNAVPLAPRLEKLLPYIKNYDVADRVHGFTEEVTWKTNWKCLAENFMEGYHLDITHPKTLKPLTPTGLCEYVPSDGNFNAYYSYYDPSYPERGPFPPNLTDKEKRCSFMFGVFPNLVVAAAPNVLIFLCLSPNTANSVNIRWGMSALPQSDGITAEQHDFMDQVNAEDKSKLETMQQGLQSRYIESSPFCIEDLEGTIVDMYRFMATRLGSDVVLDGAEDKG